MKLIAHRGNTNGTNFLRENSIEYIDEAISKEFDVEIDIRYIDKILYLGHDEPQHQISLSWLVERKDNLWIHCKDLNSLNLFCRSVVDFNYFWHQEDDFTLTSKNYIWTYPGKEYCEKSIIVMPELNTDIDKLTSLKNLNCQGICSDYVGVL